MPPHLPLVLAVIFALECFIVLHTLAPLTAPWSILVIGGVGGSAIAVLNPPAKKPMDHWVLPWLVAEAVGIVLGETIAYFVAVPWQLSWICMGRDQYDVEVTMFLRFMAILLAITAWRMTRRSESASHGTRSRRWPYSCGLAMGLMIPLLVAVIPAGFSLVYGHRPSLEVQAESRAAAQLGPEYAGYRYLVRRLDQVFRKESVTIEASVIAYDVDLHDVRDLTVTWTER